MQRPLLEATNADLQDWLQRRGEPRYRAKQIRAWVLHHRADSFEAMTDLPRALRAALAEEWSVFGAALARIENADDLTQKLLLRLADGKFVECVLLIEDDRRTVCLSTQVGCAMGCVFCASGLEGVERNLTTGEMLEQLVLARNLLPPGERLTHIVVMGMGEPLANLDALLPTLEIATAPEGLGISARHVTVSTVGLIPRIDQLAESGKPYHLAISLHAPNDTLRQEIVPTGKAIHLADLIAAGNRYRAHTGRQVTYEYVLLGHCNDAPEHARQLAGLLVGSDAFINLIPYNPVAGLPYATPAPARSNLFADILRQAGLTVKVRKRKGANINAACGQLRRAHEVLVSLG